MVPVSQMMAGVRPLEGEPLVYLVQSGSRKGLLHRVDFTAWSGFGECGCESFQMRIAPLLREGCKPVEALECPHIRKARRYLALDLIQKIIARREAKAHENQKKNGHKPSQYENENCPY